MLKMSEVGYYLLPYFIVKQYSVVIAIKSQ